MVTVVALTTPLVAYVWAACCVALYVRVLEWVCGALSQDPDITARCAEKGLISALVNSFAWADRSVAAWARIRADAKAALALASSFIGVVLAVRVAVLIIGWPVVEAYSPHGLASDDRNAVPFSWSHLVLIASGAIFIIVFETVRDALRRAYATEVYYWVPGNRAWSALQWAEARHASMVVRPRGSVRAALRLTWPPTYVTSDARRLIAAQCHVRLERIGMTSAIVLLVVAGTAAHCWIDLRSALPAYGKELFSLEIVVLFMVTAVRSLAPVRRATVIPVRLRVQVEILACLATVPASTEEFGWTDPVGTHRTALAAVARDLRTEAQRIERRSALTDTGGHPYAVVLRAVARAVTRYVTSSRSLDGTLPRDLRLILTRSVAAMAGAQKEDTLRELAASVHAFAVDGTPEPDLVGRPPGRVAVFAQALPGRIEIARRTLGAVIAIACLITVTVWLATGRIHRDSIPSWLKF